MSAFRIKLYGISDLDSSVLKSMLNLAGDLLTHEWIIVDSGIAELSLYSFDSEEGTTAWQQRGDGLTALLANKGNITEPVDVLIKKPLRTTNFAEALNLIEDKVSFINQGKQVAKNTAIRDVHPVIATDQKPSKKSSSFFSFLSSSRSSRSSEASSDKNEPQALFLHTPELEATGADTIIDSNILKTWISQLPANDNDKLISSLLGNLIPLNRVAIASQTRLELLEIYRTSILKVIFSRDIVAIERDLHLSTEHMHAIRALSLAIEEVGAGYKRVANEFFNKGDKPQTNKTYLFTINRATELLAIQVLYAYQYYHPAPSGALHELHQLYLYNEHNKTLHSHASFKNKGETATFFHLYTQLILTGIADPYALSRFDAFRLFNIMKTLADKVEINTLTNKQKKATSDFLMTGHFCIDCSSDHIPTSMVKTALETRALTQTRLLNAQPVLLAIEQIFKKIAASSSKGGMLDLDMQLLKKTIPHLNTTYERQYHRLPSVKHRKISLLNGIEPIHNHIKDKCSSDAQQWTVLNQGSGGMMLAAEGKDCFDLHIGDFIGIIEPELPAKLASIRWLQIDKNKGLIGIEIHPGHPEAVFCSPEGDDVYFALRLPEIDDIKQPATLIAEKGLFSPQRKLNVQDNDHHYTVITKNLIESTFNYDQFSFDVKSNT